MLLGHIFLVSDRWYWTDISYSLVKWLITQELISKSYRKCWLISGVNQKSPLGIVLYGLDNKSYLSDEELRISHLLCAIGVAISDILSKRRHLC
jgi:hypothetical protein